MRLLGYGTLLHVIPPGIVEPMMLSAPLETSSPASESDYDDTATRLPRIDQVLASSDAT